MHCIHTYIVFMFSFIFPNQSILLRVFRGKSKTDDFGCPVSLKLHRLRVFLYLEMLYFKQNAFGLF